MIKISKDFLFISSRIGPLTAIIIHICVISILINIDLRVVYLGYMALALAHFFITTIWKRFLLSDVYVKDESNEVIFKDLRDSEEIFNRKQIIKQTTYFGITTVIISSENKKIRKYFMATSPANLEYLEDGAQLSGDNSSYQEDRSEKLVMEFLRKKKRLFFIPLITMSLLAFIAFLLMKRDNRKILDYEFNGRVDSIWYDRNRSNKIVTQPTVFIHGKPYDLFYHTWGFRRDIQPGDSLIKLKNTLIVTLLKKDGEKLVYKGD